MTGVIEGVSAVVAAYVALADKLSWSLVVRIERIGLQIEVGLSLPLSFLSPPLSEIIVNFIVAPSFVLPLPFFDRFLLFCFYKSFIIISPLALKKY